MNDEFDFNKVLNEELSVSDEVLRETKNIANIIKKDIETKEHQTDIEGEFVSGKFEYNFFGTIYIVSYKCYTTIRKKFFLKELVSTTYLDDKRLDLNLSLVYENLFFDGPISHEILHIFQYSKNKYNYLANEYFRKLYDAQNYVLKNHNNFNEIDINFAKALYATFPFEQDAMCHCYYTNLYKLNTYEIQFYIDEMDEWTFLSLIKDAIKNINLFDEKLFNSIITKNKFLKRLQTACKRFEQKIGKTIQKVYKDKDEVMKNLNLNEGLIQYHFINKKLLDRFERHDN